ncbi:MAG: hypothetical protein KAQ89_00055 [Planctomycetes bacterium]|nr:hypothetical protein [Planctomycetota bacterium]
MTTQIYETKYETLHIYGFPSDIVPAINKYNREHPGPKGDAINITQICPKHSNKTLKSTRNDFNE